MMRILVTNDDGYFAQGISILARMMQKFGEVTVIAPKYHQSGTSMAVSMGFRQIAVKDLGMTDGSHWYYLDGTPASCVKFGIDNVMADKKPDVVVCGINHGSNAATAVLYSGTIGAAQEAAVNGIPAIGVSLDDLHVQADFSCVEQLFPAIFLELMKTAKPGSGIVYNVNFPALPASKIKGIRIGSQGKVHWADEFQHYDCKAYEHHGISMQQLGILFTPTPEEGEETYMMTGTLTDNPGNAADADHHLIRDGYVSIVPHSIDTTDYSEQGKLKAMGLEKDFNI